MVWYGMVWYGIVWYGMVWYGILGYGMVLYGMPFTPVGRLRNALPPPPAHRWVPLVSISVASLRRLTVVNCGGGGGGGGVV